MKCRLFAVLLAACSLAACNETLITNDPVSSEEMVNLKISINHAETKVNWTTGETSFFDAQIYVFREDMKLEAYEKKTSISFNLNLTKGTKHIYVLLNAPEISNVFTYDELCAHSTFYKNNALDKFVMEGHETVELESASETVTVNMNRVMAKISFVDIKNDLKGVYAGQKILLKKAYLINIAGDRRVFAEGDEIPLPTIWLHKREFRESDEIKRLTFVDYAGAEVLHTKSYTDRQDYYCYPNSTSIDSSDENISSDQDFIPRYTRLVLEAEIKGTRYYYPVSVPNIESNKNYEVSLTITRLGSTHPDIPFYAEDKGFNIEIKPWEVKAVEEKI